MLERITFQIANNRGKYTHFIHENGDIACLKELDAVCEAKVAVMCDIDFPKDLQVQSMLFLAGLAVGINPHVVITFEQDCAPFEPVLSPNSPLANFFINL